MKTRISIISITLSLLVSGFLAADSLKLNDGKVLEGKILKEDETSYTMKIEIQPGIFSEESIKKADVVPGSVEKTTAADYAFEKISGLVPSRDRLVAAEYREMIDGQVKPFIDAFEGSKHVPPAEEMVVLLEEEYKKAAAGGLKLDGKWITPEDRVADAYELDARMSYDDFNSAAEAGKFVQAFRGFESFEKSFTGSGHYEKSVEFAKTLLRTYQTKVKTDLDLIGEKQKQRALELTFLEPAERKIGEDKIARRASSYAKLLKRERASGTKWLTLEGYHKGPMEDTLRAIDGMTRRLEVLDLSKIELIDPVYKQALAAISDGNSEKARELLAKLTNMGLPASYITVLEEPLPTEDTETPTPTPAPDASDPTPDAPSTPDKPTSDTTDDPALDEAMDEGSEEAAAVPEGGLNITAILMIVIGLVLVIAVVAVFAGGKKK